MVFPRANRPFLPPGAGHGRSAGRLPAAGGTPFATLTPAPPHVYCVPAVRELVSAGPLPLPVSGGGHARPLPHPAGFRPSRVQKALSCPRDQLAAASRVQNGPPCPRDLPAAGQKTAKIVRRRVGGLLPGRETAKTVPAGAGKAECENRRGVGGGSEGWRGRKQAPNLHSSVFFSGNNCYICQN